MPIGIPTARSTQKHYSGVPRARALPRGVSGVSSARAIAIGRGYMGKIPAIPPPPRGAIPAAAIVIAAGWVIQKFAQENAGETTIDSGDLWYLDGNDVVTTGPARGRSDRGLGWFKYESMTALPGGFIDRSSRTSKHEVEVYGEHYDDGTSEGRVRPTIIIPPLGSALPTVQAAPQPLVPDYQEKFRKRGGSGYQMPWSPALATSTPTTAVNEGDADRTRATPPPNVVINIRSDGSITFGTVAPNARPAPNTAEVKVKSRAAFALAYHVKEQASEISDFLAVLLIGLGIKLDSPDADQDWFDIWSWISTSATGSPNIVSRNQFADHAMSFDEFVQLIVTQELTDLIMGNYFEATSVFGVDNFFS